MKKTLSSILFTGLMLAGCQPAVTLTPPTPSVAPSAPIAGDHGPYETDFGGQSARVSVSDHRWGVAFPKQNGQWQVVVNDQTVATSDDAVDYFMVTDDHLGYTTRKQVGNNLETFATIDSQHFGPLNDNVEFHLSGSQWGIKYYDATASNNLAIVNGKKYAGVQSLDMAGDNSLVVYAVSSGAGMRLTQSYYAVVNGTTFGPYYSIVGTSVTESGWGFVFARDDASAADGFQAMVNGNTYPIQGEFANYLGQLVVFDGDRWGYVRSEATHQGQWIVTIFDHGQWKDYGPYFHFTDPREPRGLTLSKHGFVICEEDKMIIVDELGEKKIEPTNIECGPGSPGYTLDDQLIYQYRSGAEGNHAVVGDKDYGPYKFITGLFFNNSHWLLSGVWGASDPVDKDGYALDSILDGETVHIVGQPSISGSHWAYAYEKDGKLTVKVGE